MSNFRRKSRNNKKRTSNRRNSQRRFSCPKPRRNQRNSRRRNQRNSRRRNQRKSRRRNHRKGQPCELKGGAIPFSELGLAYDNIKYGIDSAISPFQDQNSGVPNNPTSHNVNPNPTSQFLSSKALDDAILGPDLQTIHTNHFA